MYPAYRDDGAVGVIVDIFRASTSMCTALANGASAIIPVASVEK
ncbi:MAG: 2-phosphosulfolactate phosphatase, partial [Tannerellaceae bacterium]